MGKHICFVFSKVWNFIILYFVICYCFYVILRVFVLKNLFENFFYFSKRNKMYKLYNWEFFFLFILADRWHLATFYMYCIYWNVHFKNLLIQLDNVYWLDEIYRCFIPTFYFPSDLFLIIGFESEYESDISSIQTNNSFSSLSEI